MIGASDDDCKLLVLKRFILTFESGVIVIKHWKIHNYIQKDRYKETVYLKEKSMLEINDNKAYTECIQDVYNTDTQVSIGKVSQEIELEKGKSEDKKPARPRFTPPTLEDVKAYCIERGNNVDAQRFIDYYTANGWKVGKNPMKDWKASVRTWERNSYNDKASQQQSGGIMADYRKLEEKIQNGGLFG